MISVIFLSGNGFSEQIIEMISVLMTSLVHNSPKKTVLESKNPPEEKESLNQEALQSAPYNV